MGDDAADTGDLFADLEFSDSNCNEQPRSSTTEGDEWNGALHKPPFP